LPVSENDDVGLYSDLRAQAVPTKMMMRQTARPTNEIDTISRTATNTCIANKL